MSDHPSRYLLVGAHLPDHGSYDGIVFFDLDDVSISGVAYDPDFGTADRTVIERVARLRQTMTAAETFIAFRYGTTAGGLAEVSEKCGARTRGWRQLLEASRGLVEYTLKAAPESKVERPLRSEVKDGREYMQRLQASRATRIDEAFRRAVDERLGSLALKSRWNRRADGGHELAALARREAHDSIAAAGERLKSDFPNVAFLLSGPWPLEVFVDE
jgi:hypothetical protein